MTLHTIDPVWDENSKVLILGSFPSVKSREEGFFYGHKQNRFWRVLASVCDCSVPQNIDEKKSMLLANGIAVWDVIHSCDIVGSSDSSIKNVVPNDIADIVKNLILSEYLQTAKRQMNCTKNTLSKPWVFQPNVCRPQARQTLYGRSKSCVKNGR